MGSEGERHNQPVLAVTVTTCAPQPDSAAAGPEGSSDPFTSVQQNLWQQNVCDQNCKSPQAIENKTLNTTKTGGQCISLFVSVKLTVFIGHVMLFGGSLPT